MKTPYAKTLIIASSAILYFGMAHAQTGQNTFQKDLPYVEHGQIHGGPPPEVKADPSPAERAAKDVMNNPTVKAVRESGISPTYDPKTGTTGIQYNKSTN